MTDQTAGAKPGKDLDEPVGPTDDGTLDTGGEALPGGKAPEGTPDADEASTVTPRA